MLKGTTVLKPAGPDSPNIFNTYKMQVIARMLKMTDKLWEAIALIASAANCPGLTALSNTVWHTQRDNAIEEDYTKRDSIVADLIAALRIRNNCFILTEKHHSQLLGCCLYYQRLRHMAQAENTNTGEMEETAFQSMALYSHIKEDHKNDQRYRQIGTVPVTAADYDNCLL